MPIIPPSTDNTTGFDRVEHISLTAADTMYRLAAYAGDPSRPAGRRTAVAATLADLDALLDDADLLISWVELLDEQGVADTPPAGSASGQMGYPSDERCPVCDMRPCGCPTFNAVAAPVGDLR